MAPRELFSSLLGLYLPMKLPSSSIPAATRADISTAQEACMQRGWGGIGISWVQQHYKIKHIVVNKRKHLKMQTMLSIDVTWNIE